jgi:hypothetical protein
MAYSVDNYNRSKTIFIEDGTIDNTLDVRLIGKSYAGYGEIQNENFVYLLENFAGINPPNRPINGQLWYDSQERKIKVYDAAIKEWKSLGSANSASSQPTGLSVGDLWWDENNNQLYVYNGKTYTLIGPLGTPGLGTTEMKTETLVDTLGTVQTVIIAFVNDVAVYVISAIEFTPNQESQEILGGPVSFPRIKKGITIANTDSNGITSSSASDILWGTASSSLGIVSNNSLKPLYTFEDFVLKEELSFEDTVKFSDKGYFLGDSDDLEVKIQTNTGFAGDGLTPIFNVRTSNTIKFQTSNGINTPLTLVDNNILPGTTETTNLGSTSLRFNNLFARFINGEFIGNGSQITNISASNIVGGSVPVDRLTGTYNIDITGNSATSTRSTESNTLFVSDVAAANRYRPALVSSPNNGTPNSIACRDLEGSINAVQFRGTATSALFADLAEKYLADQDYETGTVVVIGGAAEVTACKLGDRAFGAVSANPAFKMNDGLEGGTYIALKGRVPVKIFGPVNKGDRLIACDNGCAGVSSVILKNMPIRAGGFPDTFAIALETNLDPGVKLVEAVIL